MYLILVFNNDVQNCFTFEGVWRYSKVRYKSVLNEVRTTSACWQIHVHVLPVLLILDMILIIVLWYDNRGYQCFEVYCSSSGYLHLNLCSMLHGAPTPDRCGLIMTTSEKDNSVSLFKQRKMKGWWPVCSKNDTSGEVEVTVRNLLASKFC